jgi:hypothetical protein
MANANAQLAGANLQIIDNSNSVQRVNSPITTIVAQTNATFYDTYFLVASPGPASLTLPGATVWVLSIKNLSGSNTISITLTPTGGAAWASPYVLVPNGIFLTMATFSTNPGSGGFTALSLGASGANTYAEIFMAA